MHFPHDVAAMHFTVTSLTPISPAICLLRSPAVTNPMASFSRPVSVAKSAFRLDTYLAPSRLSRSDLDAGTLRVERSVEETRAGLRLNPPKTKRGRRSITLGEGAGAALHAHKVKQLELRLMLGLGKVEPTTEASYLIAGSPAATAVSGVESCASQARKSL